MQFHTQSNMFSMRIWYNLNYDGEINDTFFFQSAEHSHWKVNADTAPLIISSLLNYGGKLQCVHCSHKILALIINLLIKNIALRGSLPSPLRLSLAYILTTACTMYHKEVGGSKTYKSQARLNLQTSSLHLFPSYCGDVKQVDSRPCCQLYTRQVKSPEILMINASCHICNVTVVMKGLVLLLTWMKTIAAYTL